jgi:hypothetical protein
MYNKKIKTTPSTYFCRPSWGLQLFPTGCKIRYDDFFNFTPASENFRQVEFTKVGELL